MKASILKYGNGFLTATDLLFWYLLGVSMYGPKPFTYAALSLAVIRLAIVILLSRLARKS